MAWLAAGLAWNSNAGWEMLLLLLLAAYGAQDAFLKLAQIVAAEETPEGSARLIVYGRKGCPLCAYFKLVVLPVMAEEYGDSLEIEERAAGPANIPVPLFFVNGAVRIALEPMDSPLGRLGGFRRIRNYNGWSERFSDSGAPSLEEGDHSCPPLSRELYI